MSGARESDRVARGLLVGLVVVAVLLFPGRMLLGARGQAQERIAEVEAELSASRAQLAVARSVLADPLEARDLVERFTAALPPEVDLAGILDDFATAAAASGVRFISVAPDEDAAVATAPATTDTPEVTSVEVAGGPVGGLQTVLLQLSVQANPASFAAFLDELRAADRLYVVEPRGFVWGTQASPDFFVANLAVSAFVWPDEAAVGELAQQLAGAAPASPPPRTPPTTTAPSPGLPAGVVIEPVVVGERCSGLVGAAGRTAAGVDVVCAEAGDGGTWEAR